MNGPYSTQHGTRSPKQQIQNFFQNQRNNNSQQNSEQDLMPQEQQRNLFEQDLQKSNIEEEGQNISIPPCLQRQGGHTNTEGFLREDFTFTQPNQNEQQQFINNTPLVVDKLSKIPKNSKIYPSFLENRNDFQQKIHLPFLNQLVYHL